MGEPGRRPEPIAKLSDYLVVAASCSRCRAPMRILFSHVAQQRRLSCDSCGLSWDFDLDGDVLRALDQSFRRLEDPVLDREAWVELRPYP